MELSQKQKEIIESKEKNIVVISSSASGKTVVVIERIKYLLNSGINPDKIVVITFTNLAAEEIRERIGIPAKGLFIGTIHSYCNRLLLQSGIETSDIIESEKFDELFYKIKSHLNCIKTVEHLLLDEAQDTDKLQFEFLLQIVKPKNFMFIGDFRQSIYQFRGARPDLLINLAYKSNVMVYSLNENYRNGKEILDYAKMIIRQNGAEYIDDSIPMSHNSGKVIVTNYSINGIINSIKKTDKFGNYSEWFILCRYNSQVENISNSFSKNEIPNSIIRRKDFSSVKELEEKMNDNTVKIMTIHQSKGLEAKNVVVIGATMNKHGNHQDIIENTCLNYVAATRAKELLVWTHTPQYQKRSIRPWE